MEMTRLLPALMLVMAAILAGCAGKTTELLADDDQLSAPTFGEDAGAVDGLVLDEEGHPVPGAMVGVLRLDVTTTTTSEGRFVLSNLPVGRHAIVAQKLGYDSALQQIDVKAGEIAQVQVVLRQIIIHTPHHTVWGDRGFFECSWTIPTGSTGMCGFGLPNPVGSTIQSLWTNNKRHWVYDAEEGVVNVFNEMVWSKGSFATGDTLRITFSFEGRPTNHWYCGKISESPVQMQWVRGMSNGQWDWEGRGTCVDGDFQLPGSQPQTIPGEGQQLRSFVNTGPWPHSNNFGLAWQQSFDIWFSLFYWEAAPEGYSGLPDA